MKQTVMLRSYCCLIGAVCCLIARADESISDSTGSRYRLLEGGRFVQGTSGGERVLQQAFPLSTAGQFYGNAEEPAHVTWITKPFYLATSEVTVGQFKVFVDATEYKTSAERGKVEMVGWDPTPDDARLYKSRDFARNEKFNWRNPGFEQSDKDPVVGVSWADAKAYCRWLSKKESVTYRLPTEAEWEFACRAGTTTWFSFGDKAVGVAHRFGNLGNVELEKHRKHAAQRQWLLDWDNDPQDGHVFTAAVKSFKPNPWGFYDMHGNVWEWCDDLWLDTIYKDYKRPKFDQPCQVAIDPVNKDRPQTPTNDFHAIRGGSWYNGDLICRSANRTYWDREDAACYLGFRVARDAGADAPDTARTALAAEQAAIQEIETSGGLIHSSDGLDLDVRFTGDPFDESILTQLKLLPDLKRLRIAWRTRDKMLTNSGLETISGLERLELLEFSSAMDANSADLSVLARLKNLQTLRFPRAAPLNDQLLAALDGLTSLKEFHCYGTSGGLTDTGVSHLKNNRDLEVLDIRETSGTGSFLADFVGCPLRELSAIAVYNQSGLVQDEFMQRLSEFPELRSLDLTGQAKLTRQTLATISQLKHLQILLLDNCTGLKDADFAMLAELPNLRTLELRDTHAADISAAAIAQIPRIESVKMRCDDLTDIGLKSLSAAFSLQRLEVASESISDLGVRSLGRINRLDTLSIGSSKVVGTGLEPIADLPSLRDVNLITPGLTDVAFDYLCRAKSIQKLRLAHRGHQPPSALTDDGLMTMAKATWLRELWLPRNDTGITEAKIDELDKQMPKTRVIPYTVSWEASPIAP